MAGTGDRESPCERRPLTFPPRPAHLDQVATLLPQGALEDSAAGGRAPEAGTAATRDFTPPSWEPAARYSQQCTSCFKKSERVCWPRGARSSRPASERAGGLEGAAACITGHLARGCPAGSGVRTTRLASRGPASPCRPRLRSSAPVRAAGRTSPPPTPPRSRLPRGSSVFASLLPHLPVQPPPPKRRITSGKVYRQDPSFARGEEAASMQIWEVSSYIPALAAGSFRMGNYLSGADSKREACAQLPQ